MLRRRTKPLVAAKPNGPLWIAEELFRDDRALLVDDDAVAPLSGDNHLSTALVDYLLQRSLQPTDLQDTTLVGSANSLHFFHQVNAKIATAPSDPNVAKSVENIRQRCSHYKDNKFEFLSPFCIDHHFVAVKIVFDLRSPDIFHEVSVYDSLIKGGRRNNSVHRNSPPAKYLRSFQQFIANFCLFGNPKCEVLLANPDHIVEKAVYRSCPMQQNGFDCGLFAFGCVLHLLKGLDVSADIFNQQHISKLRESLHAVFTVTDIGSDVPNPRELLSSLFLSSFFPLQSEKDCHDDVFLRLLQDLPNNDNDIDAAPDVPDKGPPIELDVVPLHPRLGADPQPEPTRHRDNYFTTQFIEVPKEFEDMSKVDLAIDDYEESSGVRLVIARSRGAGSRLYFCASHTGCCFRAKFGRERGTLPIIYKQELSNPFHCGEPVPPKTNGRAPKKRVRDKLEESVDHVIEVKDSTPVPKDVMKAAANIQSVRASYNQAYRAIGRAVENGPREKQQASFGLIMSYLKHFQLRNEDSTVKAESDADQRLRRLGICPGIMRRSLQHVRPVLSLDGAHLLSKWKGTLYIASVQTACSNIYPVSFAIMKDGEDAEGWKWFLELLVEAIPLLKMQHPDNRCRFCYFTVISDRQKGLIQALQQVFPDNHHCFCSVHIARNVEKEVGKKVAKHVHALSATFSKRESDELMAKINAISARGKKYLEGISANQWRSTAWVDDPTLPPRFGIVTTNMSESVNSMVGDARDGSWLECTNDIVRKMMNRICSLREENYGREGVVDKVAEILENRWKNCSNFQVREVVKGGSQFDVFRPSRGASLPETNRLLYVREQTCECGKWQEHGVPCIDAVAYYRLFETQTLQYIMDNHVSEHYKYETVNELLKENIVPVSLDILDQDGVTLPPNCTKRSSGRPRKKRIRKRSRFAHDPDKSPIVCSRCKKRGHNVKTCVAREQLEKQHPAELDLS
ncbi:MULE transposase domain containing protein [Nitzschia inconspicua]|uniref:MULE transposase domain containing protein n=1 Tax=Nitzschia inconspicua TaxID=303405 RepID=A0A9K3PZX7_9STRA|nr:MULE transposase domain containing protein [Nitzschia inconspicua]